jgi:D-alanyl-lipoteichoic acid acyltransferase DltB (MBOAT superfamily)
MLFNSYIFWLFFAIVILLYRLLPFRAQNRMLLLASYTFYASWNWVFIFLLSGHTLMDFFLARAMHSAKSPARKKQFLILAVTANLSLLGFFKYYGFFSHELAALLSSVGINAPIPILNVILPVGISFYTFQELSYLIDIYKGRTKPVKNILDFALYVSFFPQLVAGPIERSDHLIPQLLNPRKNLPEDFSEGTYLVLAGLFRKIVIADNMAALANAVFSRPTSELTGAECLIGIYAFALQIYGDFSGYSSIAQGIARWMGIRLMDNFRMPYLATSPSDFWRRWHISLSTWLRDYLYIPLGGNRGSNFLTYRNLMLTMTIGGLWHGANWTYIAWGIYHGALLCIWRPFEQRKPKDAPPDVLPFRILKILLMFHLVCIGWLLFRAESMTQAALMLQKIATNFQWTPGAQYSLSMILLLAAPLLLFEIWLERRKDILALVKVPWLARGLAYSYLVWMLQVFPAEAAHEFIYFQF